MYDIDCPEVVACDFKVRALEENKSTHKNLSEINK